MATEFEYIVIGSGAGGGPLAANLAKAGFEVLLVEAGGDPCSEEGQLGRLMYEVPIFHGDSTEYQACAWDYFVRHYTSDEQQSRDTKTVKVNGKDTIWYPRAGTLGGCTAHHAMITVVPQDSDWNYIANLTGDASWRAENMRKFFSRLENCKYTPRPGGIGEFFNNFFSSIAGLFRGRKDIGGSAHGHGFDGWLPTSSADPRLIWKDPGLIQLLLNTLKEGIEERVGSPFASLETRLDPNDSRNTANSPEGVVIAPVAVDKGKRVGPREYLLSVQTQFPNNLTIKKNALVTRIIFENGTRASGVEYIDRSHVYRADRSAVADPGQLPRIQVRASREIILAAGAFNSPQLLKLSGIGPRKELEEFGIDVIVDLPGVGENLQDRYEVGVITEFTKDFALVSRGTFSPPKADEQPDVYLQQWLKDGTGVYASNGVLIGVIKRSQKKLPDPDLFIFGIPGFFPGYKPGYADEFVRHHNKFTWAILKARTNNVGSVKLASANPWDVPSINFQYFGDGNRANDPDLDAIVDGIKFVRDLNDELQKHKVIKREEAPGPNYKDDASLRQFIKNEAWGHHASCTNKIGHDNDRMAVLDSRFRVRGTRGLRVVDASVFPKIPGYFIVTPIYMVSEKAFDVIVEDARK